MSLRTVFGRRKRRTLFAGQHFINVKEHGNTRSVDIRVLLAHLSGSVMPPGVNPTWTAEHSEWLQPSVPRGSDPLSTRA